MKILVTGANGFIGRRLCEFLTARGDDVIPFDIEHGDLTKKDALENLGGVDFVYHLAARTFVPESWKNARSFYENNIMGSVTVLDFCSARKVPLVFLSAYVYGAPKYLPIDEAHPLDAPSPYHMSKLMGESLCEFYAARHGLNIRVLRPFNVYGAGQSDAFIIPKIMRQILSPDIAEIEVFDLSPKRDYIYIDDVVNAMLLSQKPWRGLEIFNVGTGVSLSVKEVIEIMLRVTGAKKNFRETGETRNNEIPDCRADITKAREILGFEAEFSFSEGVKHLT